MPTYCQNNPRLAEKWRAIVRRMNRRFKALENEGLVPVQVRIEE